MALIVQKYGGSSVADAEKIKNVARRVAESAAGHQIVVVVSAMGKTTDGLLGLARQITAAPDPREMDMLLATGEQVTIALLAMALQALGFKARSLTGAQVGIRTDRAHTQARITRITAERVRAALDAGDVAVVAGFQGTERSGRDHHARPRRLRPHRGGAGRRAQGRRVRDLHRRRRRLHRRSQHRARRAQAPARRLRRDARDGEPRRQGAAGALGGVRQEVRRPGARALDVQARPRHHRHQGGERDGRRGGHRRHPRPQPGEDLAPARARPAGHRRPGLRRARGQAHRAST